MEVEVKVQADLDDRISHTCGRALIRHRRVRRRGLAFPACRVPFPGLSPRVPSRLQGRDPIPGSQARPCRGVSSSQTGHGKRSIWNAVSHPPIVAIDTEAQAHHSHNSHFAPSSPRSPAVVGDDAEDETLTPGRGAADGRPPTATILAGCPKHITFIHPLHDEFIYPAGGPVSRSHCTAMDEVTWRLN